jgi:phage tail sheath gpL-like
MAISFQSIPVTVLVPGVYTEFDNSRAVQGLAAVPHKALIVGQVKTSGSGTAAVNTLQAIASGDEAETKFGVGSQVAEMCRQYKENDPYTELWAIGLEDDASGVAATGTVVFSGTATEDGTVDVYVGGVHLSAVVSSGDAGATTVADALDAASDAEPRIAAIGVNAAGTVTFTARWEGPSGNGIDLQQNYLQGQKTPAGLTVTIAADKLSSGANAPDHADAITAMGDTQFNTIILGTNDATEIAKWEAELSDRWGPLEQIEGMAYTAKDDTQANLTTYGNARNSQHISVMGYNNSPTPYWLWAAAVGAKDARQCQTDVSRPRQGTQLKGVLAPAQGSEFTRAEREVLLSDGISTFRVDNAGNISIERLVTTYQTNSLSVADTSYRDVTTVRTLAYLRYTLNVWIALRFPNYKLADDGTRFSPGVAAVTPLDIRAEVLGWFRAQEEAGHVEGFAQFNEELLVERDDSDPNRVNILLPTDVINALRVVAVRNQFLL